MAQPPAPTLELLVNRTWVSAEPGAALVEVIRGAGLTGTKIGCGTGDCGACTVALGEPDPRNPRAINYRAVTSCLMLAAQATGCHVVTVEGLGSGHPVPAALVAAGAIQCGYCTPGLVMAITAEMSHGQPARAAAAGNLCRCTGYDSIRSALDDLDVVDRGRLIPAELRQLAAEQLAAAAPPPTQDTDGILAGATDWTPAHRHDNRRSAPPLLLRRIPELRGITTRPDGGLTIGAAASVAEVQSHEQVQRIWPELGEYLEVFASPAIRSLATVGGNLANGSPSADLAVLLLAMGAELDLRAPTGKLRRITLPELHVGYKTVALATGELITAVLVPPRPRDSRLGFDKVTRRRTDDVAAVNLASLGWLDRQGHIGGLRLAAGGVAATPRLLARPAELLIGQAATPARFTRAARAMADVIAPIDDVHGRATYRARLLRHLLAAHLAGLDPRFDIPAALAGGNW